MASSIPLCIGRVDLSREVQVLISNQTEKNMYFLVKPNHILPSVRLGITKSWS